MKILTITALYPPYHLGGYDIRCQEVSEQLKVRGHQVRVLATTHGLNFPRIDSGDISRFLHLNPPENIFKRILSDIQDLQLIHWQIKTFKPDVLHLFHTAQLTHTLFPFLARLPMPVVYDEGGVGLILAHSKHGRWINFCDGPSQSLLKSKLKRIFCRLVSAFSGGVLPIHWEWPSQMRIYYNSAFSLARHRAAGVPVDGAQVIHSGIDLLQFKYRHRSGLGKSIQILVPGRIHPEKGLQDALDALAILTKRLPDREFHLSFVGPVQDQNYRDSLQAQIEQYSLEQQVRFIDLLPHDKMVEAYQSADFCLLLTQIPESFSRVPLEAMACGALLVTTGTGGGAEVVRDGQNGFEVPQKSPTSIAETIERLIASPELYQAVIQAARQDVEEYFSFQKYVDQIEQFLYDAIDRDEASSSIG